MRNCPNCSGTIPDDAKFCSACGKAVEIPIESIITAEISEEKKNPQKKISPKFNRKILVGVIILLLAVVGFTMFRPLSTKELAAVKAVENLSDWLLYPSTMEVKEIHWKEFGDTPEEDYIILINYTSENGYGDIREDIVRVSNYGIVISMSENYKWGSVSWVGSEMIPDEWEETQNQKVSVRRIMKAIEY